MNTSPLSTLKDIVKKGKFSFDKNFSIAWQSPSNIAIVKYWGKKNGQFPVNPSLSMTLDKAVTRTLVQVLCNEPVKGLVSVNGDRNHPYLPKMQQLLKWLSAEIPLFNEITLDVTTVNTFPHSTGIASSSSGISAFTLCLLEIAGEITKTETETHDFLRMASHVARMGSGSACRSLYSGFTVWGETSIIPGTSDEFAIPVVDSIHPEMLSLHDAILIISGAPKSLPSTLGHETMNGHPFSGGRITQAHQNLETAVEALKANDLEKLCSVAENEALTLHALIMSANPGVLLMKPATVEAIHRVREARKRGNPVFFTLDAGANLHVMYPANSVSMVEEFIRDALQPLCEEGFVIFDRCGSGPLRLDESFNNG